MIEENEQIADITVHKLEQVANKYKLNIAIVRKGNFLSLRCYR